MLLLLSRALRIETDSHNFCVQEKHYTKSGANAGKEEWRTVPRGYAGTLMKAFLRLTPIVENNLRAKSMIEGVSLSHATLMRRMREALTGTISVKDVSQYAGDVGRQDAPDKLFAYCEVMPIPARMPIDDEEGLHIYITNTLRLSATDGRCFALQRLKIPARGDAYWKSECYPTSFYAAFEAVLRHEMVRGDKIMVSATDIIDGMHVCANRFVALAARVMQHISNAQASDVTLPAEMFI